MVVLVVKVILSMKMKTYKEDQRLDLRIFLFLLYFILYILIFLLLPLKGWDIGVEMVPHWPAQHIDEFRA